MNVATEKAAESAPRHAWARAVAGLALVALVFTWAWWRTVSPAPLMTLPARPLPTPNGYDVFVKATERLVKSGQIEQSAWTARRRRGIYNALTVRQALVADNRYALDLIQEGLRLEYVQPPVRDLDTLPYTYQFGTLAHLLALKSGVLNDGGDWQGAATAKLDYIAFTETLLRGAGAESTAAALSFRQPGMGNQPDPFDHLTAAELRVAIARLEKIIARRPSFADILNEEKWLQLSIRDLYLSKSNWREAVARSGAAGNPAMARLGQLGSQARMMGIDKRRVMLDYAKYIDGAILAARNSSGAVPAYGRPPTDPVNQALGLGLADVHQALTDASVDDSNLLLRLALRCYLLEHGSYPATLQALCPAYIDRVPGNPLGGASQFVYRPAGKAYRLTNPNTFGPVTPTNGNFRIYRRY